MLKPEIPSSGSQCSSIRMWEPWINFGKVTQERMDQRTLTLQEAGCLVAGRLYQELSVISTPLPISCFIWGEGERRKGFLILPRALRE